MRLRHHTGADAVTLATDLEFADSMISQVLGLMFRDGLETDEALIFRFNRERRRAVHTFFVADTIDVVWTVDGNVTDVSTLAPWNYDRGARCDTLIELPAGRARHVGIGDELRVESGGDGAD